MNRQVTGAVRNHSLGGEFPGVSQERTRVPSPWLSWAFCRAYFTTMRPYLLFVSGITGIVGVASAPPIASAQALLVIAACFFSYGFGQALTDCFQTDTDALSSPYRPLVRGIVGRNQVMTVSLAGLVVVGVVFSVSQLPNLLLVGLAILGLCTYTWFKRRWWGGPLYNAWIVALLLVIAQLSAVGMAGGPVVWPKGMAATLAASFFAYANFVLGGYFKDLSADRATGYRTLPVVFGLRAAAWVSDLLAAAGLLSTAAALAMAGAFAHPLPHPFTLIWGGLGAGAALLAQLRLHRVRDENEAHHAISPLVHAYILLLSAVAMAHRPAWTLPLVVFYGGFLVALRMRPMREQI